MKDAAQEFKNVPFKKSSFSGVTKNLCVEVAINGEKVAVRDSKHPEKDLLIFDNDEWEAFIAGAKNGEFDL